MTARTRETEEDDVGDVVRTKRITSDPRAQIPSDVFMWSLLASSGS